MPSYVEERWISLGAGLAKLPEELLLSHARGTVLFIAGAGVSQPSGLPDFKTLVEQTYQSIDISTSKAFRLTKSGKRVKEPEPPRIS
jgi:NAD-dependent SIR2 family protein deacetylase